ncbi:MAG: hypothetical protein RSD40_01620 [Bacilli bacterium]
MEASNRGKLYSKYRDQIFIGKFKEKYHSTSIYRPKHLNVQKSDDCFSSLETKSINDEKSIIFSKEFHEIYRAKLTLVSIVILICMVILVVAGYFIFKS